MEKIVITGGAGFIGSALIGKLQKEGYETFVVDNLSFGNRQFISEVDDDHFFNINIMDRDKLISTIQSINPSMVVHLAAVHFIPYCNEHPFLSANINIEGTINVLDACKSLKNLKKVFFASTAAVYPILDDAITEKVIPAPTDIYGLSKAAGEKLMSEFHLSTGIPVVICRFFNAFGPNETNPHLIPVIQEQVNAGKTTIQLGNLDPKRDFIHTYDMANAVLLLLKKFEKGIDVFNLGRGIEYSVREIVEAFERQSGKKIEIVSDPARMRKSERMHLLSDISKLKSFLNWEPSISIDEGIKTLIQN